MAHTELKLIDKMSKKDLRQAIQACFEYAPETDPVDRLAVLQEAQFYNRELERRSDSWTSRRDLVLELGVIGLIGWEIRMGYKAERLQKTASDQQLIVLGNLQSSSQNTAAILQSLKTTTDTMNGAIQDEASLNHKVAVNVTFDTQSQRVILSNNGRTPVWLWGTKIFDAVDIGKEPRIIPAGGFSYILASEFFAVMAAKTQEGGRYETPLDLYVRSDNNKPYVVHSLFGATKTNGSLTIHGTTLSITQKDWSRP
jgi:hypothetical protein